MESSAACAPQRHAAENRMVRVLIMVVLNPATDDGAPSSSKWMCSSMRAAMQPTGTGRQSARRGTSPGHCSHRMLAQNLKQTAELIRLLDIEPGMKPFQGIHHLFVPIGAG